MRRADRLFQIVQLIRGRRLCTAQWLAERLQVARRTVYRDVADLQHQGVPIEGEAGVGYRMRPGFELPPLMFSQDEARALVAAVRLASPWLDSHLADQAELALSKIVSVLPAGAKAAAQSLTVFALGARHDDANRARLEQIRLATQDRRMLQIDYLDLRGQASSRRVRPLACLYWGTVWTLAAWCEQRQDFRSFRVDRISSLGTLDQSFRDEPGRTLADLMRRYALDGPD